MNSLNRMISTGAGLVLMILLSGCLEISMNTRVNRDGTLVRTQTLSGDSAEILDHRFPTLVDSSWTITMVQDTASGKKEWKRVAMKSYESADTMNRDTVAGLSLRVRATFEKRFRWFFTEYSYTETYLCYSPFHTLPMTSFVSQAELDQAYRHEVGKKPFASSADSIAMKLTESRYMEWRSRCIFNSWVAVLRDGIIALKNPALPVSALDSHGEELYQRSKDLLEASGNTDTLLTVARQVLKSPLVRKAVQMNPQGFAAHKAKLNFVEDVAHSLKAGVTMPGLIIDTNAPTVEGNTAVWKDIDGWAYISDFDVWVKSRVINWWAVVVGGIVVVGALGLLIAGVLRRRSAPSPAA